jgi:hypothetical protein
MPIVTLYTFDSATKLSRNLSKNLDKVVKVSDFSLRRKVHK